MSELQSILADFVLLWAVIDPIGTMPVFVAATSNHSEADRRRIALRAAVVAAGILLFFILVGELLLDAMGVSILAFQVSGGIILFLFALTMIFGESKPDAEAKDIKRAEDVAVFPLATPSIASPGAMMAVVLLTRYDLRPIDELFVVTALMLVVVGASYVLMRASAAITRVIGDGGSNIISRVMGMILASVAASQVLQGFKEYFA